MKTQLKEHIFLIGFMGVGKTATSHVLSKLSGTKEFDTDQMIVKQEHKSIPDIFAEEGEEYFRQRETEILTRSGAGDHFVWRWHGDARGERGQDEGAGQDRASYGNAGDDL